MAQNNKSIKVPINTETAGIGQIGHSRPNLPLIPDEACHPFHAKAAAYSSEACHP